ncbi:MAG: acyl-CoA dehydrogenase [Geminicoccaceae bacterium]|nr:acyl-CoA dehydrogenase [Geminicoccaceae bacterium]
MTAYEPPIDDIRFVLKHIARMDDVAALPGLEAASEDVVEAVLEEAAKLARNVWAPLNAVGDRQGSKLENGRVRTPEGFIDAYRQFAEGGWMGLVFPEEHGGQGLPWTLSTAVGEMWNAANMTLYLCPLLTQAACEALLHHGTDEQKSTCLDRLISGEWTAAMCLTEPQAGTDVGALRTRAERHGDHYRIRGQKIFITFGDQDFTDNILHLVLARLPDAPPGTKGLSLFIVPKFLIDSDGKPGRRNDMRVLKLEEKLGIHASPTCVMSYGEDDGAIGYLLGEENAGMRCMFTMMNNARLGVGLEGLGISERAYQQALAYAHDRVQGRPIIEHGDVRRMLTHMRAVIAAMRALCLYASSHVDRSIRHGDEAVRKHAANRVALLTPIVKAWCTDRAQEIASMALQVHGGMGFIEETGAAQHYRDARITPIYEGTNGIQAMDLIGRKLTMEDGRLPYDLLDELASLASEELQAAVATVREATDRIRRFDTADRAAAARPYLEMFGAVLGAVLLEEGARHAAHDSRGAEWPGLSRFFNLTILAPALALYDTVIAGAGVFGDVGPTT